MPEKDKLVIWPIYFDSDRSRQEGRMVPLAESISKPNIDDIVGAAWKSGLKPEIEREKKHPKSWHHSSGRILVPKKGSKSDILKMIARNLKGKRTV